MRVGEPKVDASNKIISHLPSVVVLFASKIKLCMGNVRQIHCVVVLTYCGGTHGSLSEPALVSFQLQTQASQVEVENYLYFFLMLC